MRRSLAVSESSPVRTTRRGRAPVARSSVSACSRERLGARAVGGVECLAEELSRFGAPIAPPKQGAEVGEGARSLQPGVAPLERVDRLAEQGRSTVTAGNDAGGALRHAECARGAECPGELELLFCEASCRLALAEREMGERGLRSPGEVTRAGDQRSRQRYANGQEVLEPFGDSSLFDPQPAAGEAKNRGGDRSALCFGVERRERLLCRVELALIDERLDEHTAVQDAVHGSVPGARPRQAPSGRLPRRRSDRRVGARASRGAPGRRQAGCCRRSTRACAIEASSSGRTWAYRSAQSSESVACENHVANENHGLIVRARAVRSLRPEAPGSRGRRRPRRARS